MFFEISSRKGMTIGMFGHAAAGEALYEFLAQRPFLNANIEKICAYSYEEKGVIPAEMYTTDPHVLLYSRSINVVIEFINDPCASYNIVRCALEHGKKVIVSNRKMMNEYYYELMVLMHKYPQKLILDTNIYNNIEHIKKNERDDAELYNSIIEQIIEESKNQLAFFH